MDKSKLQKLINEEIGKLSENDEYSKAMDNFKQKITPSGGGNGNTDGLSIEKLPKGKSILLPSLRSLEASEEIKDQEGATQWENEFMATYKLDPGHDKVRFKPAPGGRWKVSNSQEFNAAVTKTSGAAEKWMGDNK